MTWIHHNELTSNRTIFDDTESATFAEIEWWVSAFGIPPVPPAGFSITYFNPEDVPEILGEEVFQFNDNDLCRQVTQEVIDNFTDDVKREEILDRLRIVQVL